MIDLFRVCTHPALQSKSLPCSPVEVDSQQQLCWKGKPFLGRGVLGMKHEGCIFIAREIFFSLGHENRLLAIRRSYWSRRHLPPRWQGGLCISGLDTTKRAPGADPLYVLDMDIQSAAGVVHFGVGCPKTTATATVGFLGNVLFSFFLISCALDCRRFAVHWKCFCAPTAPLVLRQRASSFSCASSWTTNTGQCQLSLLAFWGVLSVYF